MMMSVEAAAPDAAARAARARATARLLGAVDDLFLADDARLSERTRLAARSLLAETVEEIEADLRRRSIRLLAAKRATAAADALPTNDGAGQRLMRAGLLRDEPLIEALVAQVRHRELADALPVAVGEPDAASLLVRLASVPDRVVASAARALIAADNATGLMLPTEVRQRLIWAIAAAIRPPADDPDVDRAIAEAVHRALSAHEEEDGSGAVALRLASAIDARADELAPLLLEALGDRRLSMFVAVLAHAVGLTYVQAQAWVLEPEDERLWLALRAIRLDRPAIARIALALSDADPRRDIEAFADRLDMIVSVDPEAARSALASETIAPALRAAILALARSERP